MSDSCAERYPILTCAPEFLRKRIIRSVQSYHCSYTYQETVPFASEPPALTGVLAAFGPDVDPFTFRQSIHFLH